MLLPLLFWLGAAADLVAQPVRRIEAAEATQGAAADRDAVYAISNADIGKYDRVTGRKIGAWHGDRAVFKHINSCAVIGRELMCAASNYPGVPMSSQIHWFDTRTMTLTRSQSLGHAYGSLTWVVPHRGYYWACFANYGGKGGEPGRDSSFTVLVRYDRQWRETGRWSFPAEVIARMTPKSASGGDWGSDGLLYVSGHDRPELYAFRVPPAGGTLELVATIAMPTGGQAIGWDRRDPRLIWSIGRGAGQIVGSRVPPVPTR